ncbi:MAG: hydroxysqualene dehydroxylase HpnE [Pseudomonadota bacterium]
MTPIIVGAGWAGLATGVELAAAGRAPVVLEAAPRPGGRARSLAEGRDNGQHLLIGAYTGVERLLNRIGVDIDTAFHREPLALHVADGDEALALTGSRLPGPLHAVGALAHARGLGPGGRRRALAFAAAMAVRGFRLRRDRTVAELLARHRQGATALRRLWTPLCLATLNARPEHASARLFLRVLADAFGGDRRNAELWFPRSGLGALLPEPAATFIRDRGGEVRTGQRVRTLTTDGGAVTGVATRHERWSGPVILATAPWHAAGLLEPIPGGSELADRLRGLGHGAITTVYLRYPRHVHLDPPLWATATPPSPWIVDRRTAGEPGWLAVVTSADDPGRDRATCAREAAATLAALRPDWPPALESRVIRERRATFHPAPGVDDRRPAVDAGPPGLWLAGDYTATGLPATLEGAVRSGVECAQDLLATPA